jgi:hypothetical protein
MSRVHRARARVVASLEAPGDRFVKERALVASA